MTKQNLDYISYISNYTLHLFSSNMVIPFQVFQSVIIIEDCLTLTTNSNINKGPDSIFDYFMKFKNIIDSLKVSSDDKKNKDMVRSN